MTTTPPPAPIEQPQPPQKPPSALPQYLAGASEALRPKSQSKALGIVAVVAGGAALLLCIVPLISFLLAATSLTCAIIALARRSGGKVLPIIGIGLSALALAAAITFTIIAINLIQQGALEGL